MVLQELEEELVKKQHKVPNILKTGEALLTDGNTKLTSALQAKDFQLAPIAHAVIKAGQKKCKRAARGHWIWEKNINRKQKQLVASAGDEPRHKKQGVPLKGVDVNVTAVINSVNSRTREEFITKGQDKTYAEQKHTKQKTGNSVDVRHEVTYQK